MPIVVFRGIGIRVGHFHVESPDIYLTDPMAVRALFVFVFKLQNTVDGFFPRVHGFVLADLGIVGLPMACCYREPIQKGEVTKRAEVDIRLSTDRKQTRR